MLTDTEEKGNYGPYKQSLRKEIYQAYAKYLIEQGIYPLHEKIRDGTSRPKQDRPWEQIMILSNSTTWRATASSAGFPAWRRQSRIWTN